MATTKNIGQILVDKAKELDPTYKPDGFNDMGEAAQIILDNMGGGGSAGSDDGNTLVLNETDSASFVSACASFIDSEKNEKTIALEGEYDWTKTYKYLGFSGEKVEEYIFTFTDSMPGDYFGLFVWGHIVVAFTVEQDEVYFYKVSGGAVSGGAGSGGSEDDTLVLNETDSTNFMIAIFTISGGSNNEPKVELEGEYDFTKKYKYLALTGESIDGLIFSFNTFFNNSLNGFFTDAGRVITFTFEERSDGNRILFHEVVVRDSYTLKLNSEDSEKFYQACEGLLGSGNKIEFTLKGEYDFSKKYTSLALKGFYEEMCFNLTTTAPGSSGNFFGGIFVGEYSILAFRFKQEVGGDKVVFNRIPYVQDSEN